MPGAVALQRKVRGATVERTTTDFPAASPGQRRPHPSHARPDHTVGQNPRPNRCRRAGRGGDAAAKGTDRCPRQTAWTVRLGTGQTRRQLAYKTRWYGSHLIIADRWFPSSKTCHACGHVQDIGWAEHWQCDAVGGATITSATTTPRSTSHATRNHRSSAVGPVGAAVKRGADRKTRPGRAGGCEARKGTGHPAGEQPRDGVRVA